MVRNPMYAKSALRNSVKSYLTFSYVVSAYGIIIFNV